METRQGTSPQPIASPELSAVDSLMWQRPDSALAMIVDYFTGRDGVHTVSENTNDTLGDGVHTVSTRYDLHYAHLLLAELLYKNDHPQTNRAELQQTVAYFDSLMVATDGSDAILSFLDARAHYINGVGYYENDSIVHACAEYLNALEVMESKIGGKDLVDKKARFMALTFNRLFDLFSSQYMMEPAIGCAKYALEFFRVAPLSKYSVHNTMYRIGMQYDNLGEIDSAYYYYTHALDQLPDTTSLYFRDLRSSIALLDYQYFQQVAVALQILKQMAEEADNEDERLPRYFTIGSIYYREGIYDSALRYLQPMFDHKSDFEMKLIAADYLSKIHDSLGESDKAEAYIRFMAQTKVVVAANQATVSRLNTLFQDYMNRDQQRQAAAERELASNNAVKRTIVMLVPIVAVAFAALTWGFRKRQKKQLQAAETMARHQLEATKLKHSQQIRQQQSEAERMLNKAEEQLKQQKAITESLKMQMVKQNDEETEKQTDISEVFLSEAVCQRIRDSVLLRDITTRDLPIEHKDVVLDEATSVLFCNTANQHFDKLETRLRERYSRIKAQDLLLCYLHLLDLDEKQMAALLNLTYSAVKKKTVRLQGHFKTDEKLADFMKKMAGIR